MKIAQIQMPSSSSKMKAFADVKKMIDESIPPDADMITLPEMFCCPYDIKAFAEYAEAEGGESWQLCADMARKRGCYVSAGSVPEISGDKIYNTAYVFDRNGKQIAKHRKIHLFEMQLRDGGYFRESDVLSAGDSITTFKTEFGTIGLAICYDIRFPEMFRQMALAGAKIILVPASFNMVTGPAHWELVFRSQAMFSQTYIIGTSTAETKNASYRSYGHSITVDPWGLIIGELDRKPGVLLCSLDLDRVEKVRRQLPLLSTR